MSKKTRVRLALYIGLFFVLTGCQGQNQKKSSRIDPLYNADFQQALRSAAQSSGSDELQTILSRPTRVTIASELIKSLSRMVVTDTQRICVVDNQTMTAHLFEGKGRYLEQLGSRGKKLGEYVTPADIAAVNDECWILDFTNRRVSKFGLQDGSFKSSFVYTPQGFAGLRVVPRFHDTILFGNRWKHGSPSTGAQLVHFYKPDGEFVESKYDFPISFLDLNLTSYDSPATTVSKEGALWFVLPFDYRISAISPDGSISTVLSGGPSSFRTPSKPLDITPGPDFTPRFHSWELSWTPIVALSLQSGYLLVEYQTFNPLRYTIDIWRTADRRLMRQIHTNSLLLTTDSKGRVWFLLNLDSVEQTQYKLVSAEISLELHPAEQ